MIRLSHKQKRYIGLIGLGLSFLTALYAFNGVQGTREPKVAAKWLVVMGIAAIIGTACLTYARYHKTKADNADPMLTQIETLAHSTETTEPGQANSPQAPGDNKNSSF